MLVLRITRYTFIHFLESYPKMPEKSSERVGPMLDPPHMGELIRASMDALGWNVSKTAKHLGCDRGTLSRVLNGRTAYQRKWRLRWSESAGVLPNIGCACRRTTSLRKHGRRNEATSMRSSRIASLAVEEKPIFTPTCIQARVCLRM